MTAVMVRRDPSVDARRIAVLDALVRRFLEGEAVSSIATRYKLPVASVTKAVQAHMPQYKEKYGEPVAVAPTKSYDAPGLKEIRYASKVAFRSGRILTGPLYDEIRETCGSEVPMLSRSRIVQVHGTWNTACELADVEFDAPDNREYHRQWNSDDVLVWVRKFLDDPEWKCSYFAYVDWAREHEGAPSGGTVRNRAASRQWSQIKTWAMELDPDVVYGRSASQ